MPRVFPHRLLVLALALSGCGADERSVVAYVSVDQIHAEPVLHAFERETGIKVRAVFDVEAAKTTGLATRLLAEKDRPRADVFWNGEFAQTLRLKQQGVLAPFDDPASAALPAAFKDPNGFWFGLGGRARVFLVNRTLLKPEDYPKSLEDFLNTRYPADRIGLALPLFGTTATHAAALYRMLGRDAARGFFSALKDRGVGIVDGNSVVRDRVADGRWMFGLTDTDDAWGAIQRGAPVDVVAPDQAGRGTFIIPGTVALIARAPHRAEGLALLRFLLRAETEDALIRGGFSQWSLRSGVEATAMFPKGLRVMPLALEDVQEQLPLTMQDMRDLFVR